MATRDNSKPVIYFLCVGNAMRSQMAEAFLRYHAGDRYEAISAGTHPYGSVMSDVVRVMADRGISMEGHTSDAIDAESVDRADLIIDMSGRAQQLIPGHHMHKFRFWRVEDPYGLGGQTLVATRDLIERMVVELVEELDGEGT